MFPFFSGKHGEKNKFTFKNFLALFEKYVININSKIIKLQVIFKTDQAAQIIQPLTINDVNYDVAIDFLNEETLDKQFLINKISKHINERTPPYDADFVSCKLNIISPR